jgi:hypothetical protein
VEFVSAEIKLRGEDPYGQVEQGCRLSIRAPTKQGYMRKALETDRSSSLGPDVVIGLPYTTTNWTALQVSIDDPKLFHQILDPSIEKTEKWSEEYGGLQVTTINLCRYEHYPPEWGHSYVRSGSYGLVLMPVGNGNTFRRIGLLFTRPTEGKSWTPIDDWFADAEIRDLTLV